MTGSNSKLVKWLLTNSTIVNKPIVKARISGRKADSGRITLECNSHKVTKKAIVFTKEEIQRVHALAVQEP
jgi:hypothetical protein